MGVQLKCEIPRQCVPYPSASDVKFLHYGCNIEGMIFSLLPLLIELSEDVVGLKMSLSMFRQFAL